MSIKQCLLGDERTKEGAVLGSETPARIFQPLAQSWTLQ